jgi:hypothetical protein
VALGRGVEERLGRRALVSASQADLSIEGRVERMVDPAGWHAVVVIRRADGALLGTREFDSRAAACDELRDSVALAMALMIDPNAVLRVRPLLAPPKPRAAAPMVLAPLPPKWHAQSGAAFALAVGQLPALSTGVALHAFIDLPRFWSLQAFGTLWAPQSVPANGSDGTSTRLSLVHAGLAACPLYLKDAAHRALRLCGGAEIGALRGAGEGFGSSHTTWGPTLDAIGSAHFDLPLLVGLSLHAGLGLGDALRREAVGYTDAQGGRRDVFDPPLVSATAQIGIAAALP